MILETIFQYWHLALLFFTVAILYSSVGFGGGSSYLAILAFFGLSFSQIKATAPLCNILVVSGNVYFFYRQKQLDWQKIISLILLSVPLAFLGGKLKISEHIFFVVLGCTLFLAAISMWISNTISTSSEEKTPRNIKKNVVFGGIIGFISGMVGIGGGIFLSPLLHLTNWDTSKKIAAASSFFILINSIAVFFGHLSNAAFQIDWQLTSLLLCAVFLGGQIGNRLRNHFLNSLLLKKVTAILIIFVSFRILWKYFF